MLQASAFYANYPKCEFNKIHVIEHTTELLVDGPMPTVVGSTSSKKLITNRKKIQMYRKYLMLAVIAFAATECLSAETLTNANTQVVSVFIPSNGGRFTYSGLKKTGIFKERIRIADLADLSEELEVKEPAGNASVIKKLSLILQDAGFSRKSQHFIYSDFKIIEKPHVSWQTTVYGQKRFPATGNPSSGGGGYHPLHVPGEHQVVDNKTGMRQEIIKGDCLGTVYILKRSLDSGHEKML